MKTISDIMVSNVFSVNNTDDVYQARMLFKEKGIRHLPVLNSENGEFIGILTQRSLLNHAFNIVEKFGLNGLQRREQRTQVQDIMDINCDVASPQMGLVEAATLFTAKKHSCLPIVENNRLQGIVTSVDFVKLALYLLEK